MNIFVLDENPIKAAQMLCDCHLRKMCVEHQWGSFRLQQTADCRSGGVIMANGKFTSNKEKNDD
jgi:hypothetical protein